MVDDHLDTCLQLVSDSNRRQIIQRLRRESRTSVDDLVDQLHGSESADATRADREQLRIQLLHNHLPKLADHDVVEHDQRSGTVRYRPDERVERVLDSLPEEAIRANL